MNILQALRNQDSIYELTRYVAMDQLIAKLPFK